MAVKVPSPAPGRRQTPCSTRGIIQLSTLPLHTVHALDLDLPKGRLIAVTGVSGSGKTTLILESLIPALKAKIAGQPLPEHIRSVDAPGISRIDLIDATPIGVNVRSTWLLTAGCWMTCAGCLGHCPKPGKKATRQGTSPTIPGRCGAPAATAPARSPWTSSFCPTWTLSALTAGAGAMEKRLPPSGAGPQKAPADDPGVSLPQLMGMTVKQALDRLAGYKKVTDKLQVLSDLGLGYLTLERQRRLCQGAKPSG